MTDTLTAAGKADAFAGEMALHGVTLPVHVSTDPRHWGVILDARDRGVLTIGFLRGRTRESTDHFAGLIAAALNAMAGER